MQADVEKDVLAIIGSKVRVENKTTLTPEDRLEDLGIESIDAVEMIFDLEEKFDVEIPYNANTAGAEFSTVGDVIAAIQKLVDNKANNKA